MTSSYLNIGSGGPEAGFAMAARLKAAGDDFMQTARDLADRIQQLEAGEPWGHDDPGIAFNKNYTGQPADGEMGANEALRTSLHDSGSSLSNLGLAVMNGMAKYGALEADNATQIGSTIET